MIYLIRSNDTGFEVDSTALRNGVFIFKGQIDEPEFAELLLYSCPFSEYEAPIFIESANMKVTGDIDNFRYFIFVRFCLRKGFSQAC